MHITVWIGNGQDSGSLTMPRTVWAHLWGLIGRELEDDP